MPFSCRNTLLLAGRYATMATIVLVACHAAVALDPNKSIGQFIHHAWQTEDGLPDSLVTSIIQTHEGYLLFGTHRGLVRFDGVRFAVFDRRNTPGLTTDSIDAVCEDASGTLWVGGAAGLHRFSGGRLGPRSRGATVTSNPVQSIVEDPAGGVWFGTAEHGAGFVIADEVRSLTTGQGLSSDKVRALCVDHEGSVWIGTFEGGLNRYRDGIVTVYTSKDGLASNNVQAVHEDLNGTLWVGTDGGLSSLKDGKFTSYTVRDGLTVNSVRALTEDSFGSLWVATFGGLNRFRDGRFSSFTTSTGLTNDVVLALLEDREGSLWIATEGGGLNRLRDGMLTAFTTADGLSHDLVCPILEDRNRNLWFGTFGGGLNRLRDGVVKVYSTKDGLSSNNLNALHEDRAGALWIGTIGGGLNKFDGQHFTVFDERQGLSSNIVHAVAEDAEGVLWVGTERGVSKLERGRFTSLTSLDGLSGDTVRVILPGMDGAMWVGTDQGLNRVSRDGITVFRMENGLAANTVWSLYQDGAGTLWIGTAGGLSRFENGRRTSYSVENGLFDNEVFQILEDDRANLWMRCAKGIFRVSKQQLDDVASGIVPSLTCVSYGRADGMRSEVCTHFFQPAGWKAANGNLWFPTTQGAVMVDTNRAGAGSVPPTVILEDVIVDNETLDLTEVADLAPGKERFEFRFTGLSFFAPESIRFRFRLEGFDEDWVDAGTRRVAYFTNLPPGEYNFRVMASTGNGDWTETDASYRFVYRSSPWKTRWAFALYAALGLGLLYAAVRLRLRAFERRNQALEEKVAERTLQLAEKVQEVTASEERAHASEIRALEASHAKSAFLSNISHELRTPLTAILGFVQLIARDASLPETHRNRLAIVLRSGEHLHGLINDVLSLSKIEAGRMTLEEKSFDLHRLLKSIEDMLRGRFKRTDVAFAFDCDESVPCYVFGDEGKLRQILINLLGNSMKFTEKGHVTLHVRWREGRAAFEVVDSGAGIAPDEIPTLFEAFVQTESGRQARQGTGLGLAISRNFVRLMNGDIDVTSEVGTGSTFRFEIDLPEASAVAMPVEARPVARLAPGQEQFRILVVDDDIEIRALFGDLLRTAGFEMYEAGDGRSGVEAWLERRPHLVFMDIRMPVMDGYAATRRIRELEEGGRRTVIVGLSAGAFKHERDAVLEAGCDDFVSKPFHDAHVLETIAEHLGAKYVYDEPIAPAAPAASVVTAERLATLTPDIRVRLKDAAVRGSVQDASRTIGEIRVLDPALAEGLEQLVASLALDELLKLVELADEKGTV
ncbi:MAG: response regulator [Blastocatellia bacterium]|nr:response regulator [Blastocatellia bacterium]